MVKSAFHRKLWRPISKNANGGHTPPKPSPPPIVLISSSDAEEPQQEEEETQEKQQATVTKTEGKEDLGITSTSVPVVEPKAPTSSAAAANRRRVDDLYNTGLDLSRINEAISRIGLLAETNYRRRQNGLTMPEAGLRVLEQHKVMKEFRQDLLARAEELKKEILKHEAAHDASCCSVCCKKATAGAEAGGYDEPVVLNAEAAKEAAEAVGPLLTEEEEAEECTGSADESRWENWSPVVRRRKHYFKKVGSELYNKMNAL